MSDESLNTNPTDEQPGQAVLEGSMEFDPKIKTQVEELVKELTAKQFQALQSMQAKQEERVKREFEKRLEALSNAGLHVTPEQAARIQEDTRKQFASEQEQPNTAVKREEAQPKSAQQPEVHPVVATANEIMKAAGITIETDDPEIKIVNQQTKDPLEFLQSVKDAVNAKAKRLSERTSKPFDPAKAPGITGAGDHGSSLESKYQEEIKKIHGDVNAIIELKKRYRAQGLKI